MAKASMTLPNGTVVQIEGSADEVRNLLHFYAADTGQSQRQPRNAASPSPKRKQSKPPSQERAGHRPAESAPDLSEIVNLAKNCDEAENIERQILDRASQVDRTLLPLYLVHEHLENAFGLSSGDISKITTDLGVPVSTPNASTTLSGSAAKYVIGDKVRQKGHAVRYKLSRRGLQYLQAVIGGKASANES